MGANRMIGWGKCQRCGRRADLGYISGTSWKVCVDCYQAWRDLPDDHPAKANLAKTNT